jgi:hypothetical protein
MDDGGSEFVPLHDRKGDGAHGITFTALETFARPPKGWQTMAEFIRCADGGDGAGDAIFLLDKPPKRQDSHRQRLGQRLGGQGRTTRQERLTERPCRAGGGGDSGGGGGSVKEGGGGGAGGGENADEFDISVSSLSSNSAVRLYSDRVKRVAQQSFQSLLCCCCANKDGDTQGDDDSGGGVGGNGSDENSTLLGVIPRTARQIRIEVCYVVSWCIVVGIHLQRVVSQFLAAAASLKQRGGQGNFSSIYSSSICTYQSKDGSTESTPSVLPPMDTPEYTLQWFGATGCIIFGILVFSEGNLDMSLLSPIVKTGTVVSLFWGSLALFIVELTTPTITSAPYAFGLFMHTLFTLLNDAAVSIGRSYLIVNSVLMIAVLAVDLVLTLSLQNEDRLLFCAFGFPYGVFQFKRILYVNLLSSMISGVVSLLMDPGRVYLNFGKSRIVRVERASWLSEHLAGKMLRDLQHRAAKLKERRTDAEHVLFDNVY